VKGASLLSRAGVWLIRVVALVALVVGSVFVAARSDTAARMASSWIVEGIASLTGREASLGRVTLEILPPGIGIEELTVAGTAGSGEAPLLHVRRASAGLSLADLFRGRFVVDEIEADGVDVAYEPGHPILRPSGPPGRAGRTVTLRRLNLHNGTLAYAGSLSPFSLDAGGVEATASSTPCAETICLDGAIRSGGFRAAWNDHRLEGKAISAIFTLEGPRLEVSRFSVTGAGVRGGGNASWRMGEGGEARLSSRISTEGGATSSILGDLPLTAETLDLTATLTLEKDSLEIAGQGSVSGVAYPGLGDVDHAEGTFTLSDGNLTADLHGSGLVPTVAKLRAGSSGSLKVRIARDADGASEARIETAPILYRDLLASIDPRFPRADVTASAEGVVTWHSGEPASLGGSVKVSLSPYAPGGERNPDPDGGSRPAIDLEGSIVVGLASDTLRFSEGRFSFPGAGLVAEGSLERDTDRMDLVIGLSNASLSETLRALASFTPAADAARLRLEGDASGRFRIARTPGSLHADGSIEGASLTLHPAETTIGPFRAGCSFDYRDGRMRLDPISLNGPDWSGAGRLLLDLGLSEPIRSGVLTLRDFPASPLWATLGASSMAGGRVSGRADFDFDAPAPSGNVAAGVVSLSLEGASFKGLALEGVTVEAVPSGRDLLIRSMVVGIGPGEISATGTYTPDTSAGRLEVRSRNLDLRRLMEETNASGPETSGDLAITGTATLSAESFLFSGSGEIHDLVLRGLPAGAVTGTIEVAADGTRVDIAAPDLATSGTLRLPEDSPGVLEMDLEFADLKLEKLVPLFPPGSLAGLAGTGTGRIWGSIPLSTPVESNLVVRLSALSLQAGGLELHADGSAEMTLKDGQAWLGDTRLKGPDTQISVSGVYDLRSGAAGVGTLQGRFDARLLKIFMPDLDARGAIEIQLQATTQGEKLIYGGRLSTDSGWVNYPGLPTPLDHVRMTTQVAPDGSLSIQDIEFGFAGGEIAGSGTGQLRGIELTQVALRLHGTSLRTVPLPDLTILFDADMTITRDEGQMRIAGHLDVVRAIYNREFELAASPALGRMRSAPEEKLRAESASPILDITIVAPSDVLVRNSAALLEGSARLRLAGTLATPEITGRISVFDGGRFRFRDVTYTTEGGGIDFDDPDIVDPALDLMASTQVQAYEIKLHVLGRYSKPRFELTSEPALPTRDIVSLLVTGRTFAETYGQEAGVTIAAEENAGQYLTAPLSEGLNKTVGRFLNLTSVQIEPQFFNGRSDPTARLTLTKRISPDLLFVYSDSLGTNQEQIYQFQYDLTRAWQLLGTRNADGTASGDVRFRHRWGGAPHGQGGRPQGVASLPRGSERAVVGKIRITGHDEDSKEMVDSLGLKSGAEYTRADALEGREKLRDWLTRHSYPLAVVRFTESRPPAPEPGGQAGVDLTYEINPGPRVDTVVRGAPHAKTLTRSALAAFENAISGEDLPRVGSKAILDDLGSKGYAGAKVTDRVERKDGRIHITYDVDRGPKVSVRSISFDGAPSVPADEILSAMQTTVDRWNTSGKLETPALKSDTEAIRAVYLGHGYLDAEVGEPMVRLSEDRRKADIVIPVREGEVWRIGEVAIEGASAYPEASLRSATLLTKGDVLRPSAVDSAQERLRDILDANGYPDARVRSGIQGPPETATVTFVVEEGVRQVLSRVVIRGNTRTASRVILREMALSAGDPVSRSGILESQRKLYALGIFRSVDLRLAPDEDAEGRTRLVVSVVEGDPLLTAFGLGYNTEQSFQEFAQVGHNNLFGTGRSASIFLSHSALQRRAQLNVTDRRLFGIPFEGLITAFWEKDERESFDVRRRGGAVQLKHQLSRQITLFGRYGLEDVALSNVDPNFDPNSDIAIQDVRLANVAGSMARDTRDDILNPARGTFSTADARLYLTAVGSERQFARLFSSHAWFHPLSTRTVLGASARVGSEWPLASTTEVPLSERFFAGGDTTLRGFGIDQAGPVEMGSLKPIGGEFSVILNGEVRFPIIGALKGVVFYDTGNVFLTSGAFRLSGTEEVHLGGTAALQDGFRHTLGAGIRFDTPLGPLRVEYGRKLDPRIGRFCFDSGCVTRHESRYELFLSVGQAF